MIRWKVIPGYENEYIISTEGEIVNIKSNKQLKLSSHTDGYLQTKLFKNKKQKAYLVHRLVAITFLENSNNYKEVNHKNGIKIDNHISNLEWCNRQHNIQHAYDNGHKAVSNKMLNNFIEMRKEKIGEKNHMSKLLENDIYKIRNLYENGILRSEIAKLFNISWTQVDYIVKGKSWKHLK